jgi:hypothetical protein
MTNTNRTGYIVRASMYPEVESFTSLESMFEHVRTAYREACEQANDESTLYGADAVSPMPDDELDSAIVSGFVPDPKPTTPGDGWHIVERGLCDTCGKVLRPEQHERHATCTIRVAEWATVAGARGTDAAEAAASWIVDGNTKTELIPAVLAMFDSGDPGVEDYLPRRPDLSGEWAGDPTPASLVADIAGAEYADSPVLADILADAYESAVAERFESACEEQLRGAL